MMIVLVVVSLSRWYFKHKNMFDPFQVAFRRPYLNNTMIGQGSIFKKNIMQQTLASSFLMTEGKPMLI